MILQMLKKEYRQEGLQEGKTIILSQMLAKKYHLSCDELAGKLEGLESEDLSELGVRILDFDSFEDIDAWIQQQKQRKRMDSDMHS